MSNTVKNTSTGEQRKQVRSAYRWNAVSGVLFACQSVVMLMVLTRVCDVYEAGVFTIAFANANLFLNIGNFGVRKFHASDRVGQFPFRVYRGGRVVTCAAMLVASTAYLAWSSTSLGYSADKTLVMFVMVLFKGVDAVEDVYTGAYQVAGRLDVGARMVSIRLFATMVVFAGLIVAFGALLPALVLATVFAAVLLACQIAFVRRRYGLPDRSAALEWPHVWKLLRACLPLFLANFLLFYIGSAPKYAIDAMMDDAAQAYYGYIAMPVFVVTMLAGFVYNPMITELSDQWQERRVKDFALRFCRIAAIIVGLTALCVGGAWLIGVPVLNILYNTDIARYGGELLVLVTGGGFLAMATLSTLGLTIIRWQNVLVPIYAIGSVAAFLVSNAAVSVAGITGASWAYFGIMTGLSVLVSAVFAIGVVRGR